MVYVDDLEEYPHKPFGHLNWAHLWADSEIHEFAQGIGLKRAWFQPDKFLSHYDVTASKHREALRFGAILTDISS